MTEARIDLDASATPALAGFNCGGVGDFVSLLKPRVMSLVVFTAVVALAVAPVSVHPVIAFAAILSIAIGAGAAGALNMWYDADIDRVMTRTRERPIPAGTVSPAEALTFGLILSVFSVLVLGLATNWLAAGLLAFTIFFYVVIYTMWLKRSTPQNIVIGGASGALPPVIGWAAMTGTVSPESVALFMVIFVWTPPHFWALSLFKQGDYERAGVPMLPVVRGRAATRRHILAYSLLLAPAGLLPVFAGTGGLIYAVSATILGAVFVGLAIAIMRAGAAGDERKAAVKLFAFSIFYLFALFAILAVEHVIGLGGAV